jgi:dTMP kinase
MSDRASYIVIEGIDGTGKTELASRLVSPLLARGHSVSSFREPTDTFLRGQFSRLINIDALAASLSLTVDRAMLRPSIEHALAMGDIVVQDRSYYSTLAYRYPGLPIDSFHELERIEGAIALEPDLVLYLDAPLEVAMKRVESKGRIDVVEDETYLSRVKAKFEQLFQPPKWVRIDTNGTADRTLELAMNSLIAAGL